MDGDDEDHNLEKSKISSRCCPKMFEKIVGCMSKAQCEAMEEIGFGCLLKMQFGRLNLKLCQWLCSWCNPQESTITINRKVMNLFKEDFVQVIGVEDSGIPVERKGNPTVVRELKKDYDQFQSRGISRSMLETIMNDNKDGIAKFFEAFTLYVRLVILGPLAFTYVSKDYLYVVTDIKSMPK